MNEHKGVDFSYPSSTNATKAGMSTTGCWTVTIYTIRKDGTWSTKVTSSHKEKADAFAAAAKLSQPWGGVWKRYARHAIAEAEGITPDEVYMKKPTDAAYI